MAQRYRAFPILPDGTLGEGRLWADLGGRFPDGCTLDADGAIWFADAMAPEVARVAEGGEVLDVIALPDRCFACALGGPDGRTLFVATASTFPGGTTPTGRVGSGRSRSTCPTPGAPDPGPPHRRSSGQGRPDAQLLPARASLTSFAMAT